MELTGFSCHEKSEESRRRKGVVSRSRAHGGIAAPEARRSQLGRTKVRASRRRTKCPVSSQQGTFSSTWVLRSFYLLTAKMPKKWRRRFYSI